MSRTEQLVLVWLAGALIVVAIVLSIPSVSSPLDAPSDEEREFVEVGDNGTEIWPYVAAEPSFENPRGSINVVFYGEHVWVRFFLRTQVGTEFEDPPEFTVGNETNETEIDDDEAATNETGGPILNRTRVAWKDAYGADRYTYVQFEGEESGTWIPQSYQLHYGDYFGKQYHLRVFEPPEQRENWTAVQAHSEHWDWFVLTHTVDGLEEAQVQVELDFMEQSFVSEVSREYYYNRNTYDADGWTTVVRLSLGGAMLGLAMASTPRRFLTAITSVSRRFLDRMRHWASEGTKRNHYRLALFSALLLVVLGVRAGGVVAERFVPIHRFVVTPILYSFLVVGVPLSAYTFGRRLRRTEGFLLGTVGFGTAVLLEYSYLNIAVLPIEVVLHRLVLAVAVGLLAAGARRRHEGPRLNRYAVGGALLWSAMVVLVQLL